MTEKTPSIRTRIAICVCIALANILLARYAALSTSAIPGVVTFYFAVAFMIAFALWFGTWGAIAAYVGCLVGSGIPAGLPLPVNLYWSLADVWQVLIPLAAFRILKADTGLKTKRDFAVFFAFAWLLNNLAGAAWGTTMFVVNGKFSAEFSNVFLNWFIGNLAVTFLITPVLLKLGTPILKRKRILTECF
ncbi:MAG: MASE1 domain-containing protein [Planctomycetes bacterium]|nr:MASE1 domain-containing protein [Planctomycetota bacterium]